MVTINKNMLRVVRKRSSKEEVVEVEEVTWILIMILITLIITMSINIEIMMMVVTMTDCNAQEGSVPQWTSST